MCLRLMMVTCYQLQKRCYYDEWILDIHSYFYIDTNKHWISVIVSCREYMEREQAKMNNVKYKFKVVCICGSMRFYKTMLEVAEKLTYEGYIVLMPFASKDMIDAKDNKDLVDKEFMLDVMHLYKIDMAELVIVVDTYLTSSFELQYPPYIGESTKREIVYASKRQIDVLLYSDLMFSNNSLVYVALGEK